MDGKIVYYRIYDIGGIIDITKLKNKTEDNSEQLQISSWSSMPYSINASPYCVIKSSTREIETSVGKYKLEPEVKVFSIGVVSVNIRINFNGLSLDDMYNYYNLKIKENNEYKSFEVFFDELFDDIYKKLKNNITDKYKISISPEIYVVFCVHNSDDISVKEFLTTHNKKLAALLTNRKIGTILSDTQTKDILSSWFSYEESDLVIMDWDSAFVVNPSRNYEDILLVLEFSNLMLLELRTYDLYLNKILEEAYQDIDLFFDRRLKYSIANDTLKDIIKTRVDLLKMTDELRNTTKFIGEWYLAKLYNACANKFRLGDWENSITKKLSTLNDLYMVLNNALHDRKMLILEYSIVLLFVIDLLILLFPLIP